MDDDMYDDDSSSYSSYTHYYSSYKPRSPPKTPPRADPVLSYDVQFIEGGGSRGKCMCVDRLICPATTLMAI